jgi:hypothetical protein
MAHRSGLLAGVALLAIAGAASAQSTGMPSYNAPYRAFARHEFGGTLSFPEGPFTGIEGQYRFGFRTWDIGFRGGILDTPDGFDTEILAGVTGRVRVLTHTEDFPLDGAVVLGIGGQFVSDASTLVVPAGLSLGRRLDVEGSQVSIVPYAQPTLFLLSGPGDTDVRFALGFGADFRLSRVFDLRASASVGDLEGFALSVVWVR